MCIPTTTRRVTDNLHNNKKKPRRVTRVHVFTKGIHDPSDPKPKEIHDMQASSYFFPAYEEDHCRLEAIATDVAMEALGEKLPKNLQQAAFSGAFDAMRCIQHGNIETILEVISSSLEEMKPVVDRLEYISNMCGLNTVGEIMSSELKECARKTSFLHRLCVFMYAPRFHGFMTPAQARRLASHSSTMSAVMGYMCMAAHFYRINLNV